MGSKGLGPFAGLGGAQPCLPGRSFPGHCAGQVALLWQGGRLLICADVCSNVLGLGGPIAFEDAGEGRRSQRRLAGLDFQAACFGHGRPIVSGAAQRLRRAFR